ncbi:MAG: Multimodular transpeptidase-transglycosylase [uncultured Blastococcus sp.]|uniref:Multimodular transpeptidase-transglycosylase n=1 Tax=uncultured Blastococcus sp. TaxID=217144 RepID=A0A6J4JM55_9ACTN|nr:MAG: Multimodular transpeptidase-transglycosylase [uncultured Blastococcus sp.]
MSENGLSRSRTLAKLAATIVVAGALLAALMLPWVGGTGLVARNSASLLDALPVELTDKTPAGNTRILAADGSLITNMYRSNRTPVGSDQIADVMKQALVDIEDSRFYVHNGLDVQGTTRALLTNLAAGSVREGGSTLTQQLVKQTLLQTATTPEDRAAANEETVGRKLKEARLALALEETYEKDEILTRYLNIVYFGQGAYGIQAAAQRYFSVNAADLTLPQAAMLAGLVQSPTNDDPITQPENATVRRDQVLNRMHELRHISDAELTEFSGQPVVVAPGVNPPNGCIDAGLGGFFCAYMLEYLTGRLNEAGLSPDLIREGGLTIQTTLRPDMQVAGDQAVLNTLPMGAGLAGMYTALEPSTGKLLAMSVNRRYGCGETDCESVILNARASQGAGSTYKVFVAAAALAEGYSPNHTITTPNTYASRVFKENGGTRGAPYDVSNVGTYPNTLDLRGALVRSSNTYFLALLDALGSVEKPVRMAQAMGLRSIDPVAEDIIQGRQGSFVLGPAATSPLDLASAYGTLAANGTQCDPLPVADVLDRNGKPLTNDEGEPVVWTDNCTPGAVPEAVATTLNQILIGDTASPEGTGTRAAIPGHDIAGKTGTSQNNWSVAFVGYTPQYTASVMVLNPKKNESVGGFGGNKPATIWNDAMTPILAGQPKVPFPPAGIVAAPRTDTGRSGSSDDSGDEDSDEDSDNGDAPAEETPPADGEGAPETEVPPATEPEVQNPGGNGDPGQGGGPPPPG